MKKSIAYRVLCLVYVAAMLVCTAMPSSAYVWLEDGSLQEGFLDLGGYGLGRLVRTYNSKSDSKGIFGWGWGSTYETYLEMKSDGSVAVHEYGNEEARILQPVKESSVLSWSGNYAGGEVLKKTGVGYVLMNRTGTESYDDTGRLVRIENERGSYVDIAYDKKGRPASIRDDYGYGISFLYDGQGFIEKAVDTDGAEVVYQLNGNGQLVRYRDTLGSEYGFEYDSENNMTGIENTNGSKAIIDYYGADLDERVYRVRYADGSLVMYEYFSDPADSSYYGAKMTQVDSGGSETSRERYDYYNRAGQEP